MAAYPNTQSTQAPQTPTPGQPAGFNPAGPANRTLAPSTQMGLPPMTPPKPTMTPVPLPGQGPTLTPAPGAAGGAPGATAAPPGVAGGTPGVAPLPTAPTSGFGPGADLRSTQINPVADPRLAGTQGLVSSAADKLANGPNRFGIAQNQFQTFAQQTDPAFQASMRDATQHAAANGRIGSGMLSTDYGNLANQRDLQLQGERDSLFNNALQGTIGDQQTNVGLLSGLEGQQYGEGAQNRNELRGERGYQNDLENQAYGRGVQGLTLQDALTNSAFGRALAQSQMGYGQSPEQMQMMLSGVYGDQAGQAGQALGGLIQGSQMSNLLKSIYGPGGAGGQGAPAPAPTDTTGGLPSQGTTHFPGL